MVRTSHPANERVSFCFSLIYPAFETHPYYMIVTSMLNQD